MDFLKLMSKAGENLADSQKKIDKHSVEEQEKLEKSLKLQLELLQKSKEKRRRKRQCHHKSPSPAPRQKLAKIPKKVEKSNSGPSQKAVDKFLAKKIAEKERAKEEHRRKREQLLDARIRANGGKISKKIAEQFKLTPEEIRRRICAFPSAEDGKKRREEMEKRKNPIGEKLHQQFMSEIREESRKNAKKFQDSQKNLDFLPKKSKKSKSKPSGGGSSLNFRDLMLQAAENKEKAALGELSDSEEDESDAKTPSPIPPPPKTQKTQKVAHFEQSSHPGKDKSSKSPQNVASASYSSKKFKHKDQGNCTQKVAHFEQKARPKKVKCSESSEYSFSSKKFPQKYEKPAEKRPPEPSKAVRAQILNRKFANSNSRITEDKDRCSEEDSDYDSEMDDFIDDTEDLEGVVSAKKELEKTLKEKFKYDKEKFKNEQWDRWTEMKMVTGYGEIQAEEARSARIAKWEDQRELLREQGLLDKHGSPKKKIWRV